MKLREYIKQKNHCSNNNIRNLEKLIEKKQKELRALREELSKIKQQPLYYRIGYKSRS